MVSVCFPNDARAPRPASLVCSFIRMAFMSASFTAVAGVPVLVAPADGVGDGMGAGCDKDPADAELPFIRSTIESIVTPAELDMIAVWVVTLFCFPILCTVLSINSLTLRRPKGTEMIPEEGVRSFSFVHIQSGRELLGRRVEEIRCKCS